MEKEQLITGKLQKGSENDPGNIYFKRLTIEDARAMSSLERLCFSLPWNLAQCEGAFTQKAFAAFGLWRGKNLVAYISFYHQCQELEILNLAVDPRERRKGYGKRILGLLLQAAAKMGMQKVALEVREQNAPAISLYEKYGFHQCGIRPKYYPDSGENALIYCRIL